MEPIYVLAFTDTTATLETVGGKGASLARMAVAGLPVPDGFYVTTTTYRQFVHDNHLDHAIQSVLKQADLTQTAELEGVSKAIRELFAQAEIPQEIAGAVARTYAALPGASPAVAVRSSATAEDLPELSFAGQQDTYLNICGIEALLEAVRRCWASLWTARAIAYRTQHSIDHESVSLAVVVQLLVPAEAAGILFTADPVTGQRDRLVISAAWGLGEAIVGGLVTPDSLQVDKTSGRLLSRQIAEKEIMTVRVDGGTQEQPVPKPLQSASVLSEAQAAELAHIGIQIEDLYGGPMDIEWALADGKFAILQARPITALPEQPLEWTLPHPKAVLARGSFAEFVPEPVTPLFATLAVPIARDVTVKMMKQIGFTSGDSYLFAVLNNYVYVGFIFTPKMVLQLVKITFKLSRTLSKTAGPMAEATRSHYQAANQKWQARSPAELSPSQLLAAAREIFRSTAEYYSVAQSGTIPLAMMNELSFSQFYRRLVKRKGDPEAATFLYGAENQAMRADKALYDLASWANEQPGLSEYLLYTPAETIWSEMQVGAAVAGLDGLNTRFSDYLNEYGHAIYDLDFAKPLPCDDPAPLLETIKVYLSGRNNPYTRQQEALQRRTQAAQAITKRLDPLRRRWFGKLLKAAQDSAPLRENSIADLGLGYPQIHLMLSELGRRFKTGAAIAQADDIYWLEAQEVEELASRLEHGQALSDLTAVIVKRKSKWQAMRRITAPSALPQKSWMSRFYPEEGSTGDTLKGFGASAGQVTGKACVMLGPEDFGQMQPGDIIVAGITTPAWTPLFARAAGIVTDIGGPLGHSSIVAREYGIPAVLGTGVATRRIQNGQTITVDGSLGTVKLPAPEDEPGASPDQTRGLNWSLPDPKGQYLRMSIIDLLPDTVSPMFDSLAIPALLAGMVKVGRILTHSEPVLPKGYVVIINNYAYMQSNFNAREWWWVIAHLLPSYPRMFRMMVPNWRNEALPRYRAVVGKWHGTSPQTLKLAELWCGIQELIVAAMDHLATLMYATTGASAGSEGLFTQVYEKMIRREGDPPATTFIMGYNTPPIQSEKSLYDLAQWIDSDLNLERYVLDTPATELAVQLDDPESHLRNGFAARLQQHMDQFGHMIYNLDFAKPLPLDDPTPMFEVIKMYLSGQGTNPYERQGSAEKERILASETVAGRVKGLRGWAFSKSLRWAQSMAEVREEAIAAIGLGYPALRSLLGELGRRLVEAGAIAQAEDIFYLRKDEIEASLQPLDGSRLPASLADTVGRRRAEDIAAGQVTPPPTLPPRKRFMGIKLDGFVAQSESEQQRETLKGVGASAGLVTAPARVLLGPQDFDQMKPGEVLVASITTPAWTPLFAMASAVVTDIGGPLSHGSIVAREYGIPAVMGTGVATHFIQSGQIITVDGSLGTVKLGNGTH
jgi:rifampicin phosphotransferase